MMHIKKSATAKLPTVYGDFVANIYECGREHHIALVKGDLRGAQNVLVRVHSECLTGEVFHSLKCDCGEQLEIAMKMISEEGGVLLYLRQEGRGIGFVNKLKSYEL